MSRRRRFRCWRSTCVGSASPETGDVMTAADLSRRARDLLGFEIEAAGASLLVRFAELVGVWAGRMNLVAAGSTDEILSRHVLDSLAPARLLAGARRVADIGSGAGFPGIPLAISMPATCFELVESRRKRASFLRHVARSLPLANVAVHEMRAEDWPGERTVDATIARAVQGETLADVSQRLLLPGGRMIVMRKEGGEPRSFPHFEEGQAMQYRLPDGERHEVVSFRRCST